LKHYFEVWRESDTSESFFYWLDEGAGRDVDLQIASRSNLEAHHVKYCTAIEREPFLTETFHGKLCYVLTGKPVEGKKIFVMGTTGHLYMADKIKGRFQHSSFLAGAAVTVAGSAEMSDGHLFHFLPNRVTIVQCARISCCLSRYFKRRDYVARISNCSKVSFPFHPFGPNMGAI